MPTGHAEDTASPSCPAPLTSAGACVTPVVFTMAFSSALTICGSHARAAASLAARRSGDRRSGLAARAIAVDQQSILRELLGTYVERLPDDAADAVSVRVNEVFEDIHFAWAGSTDPGRPHYYRLHGPRLLAEYDNTTRDANHVHTVLRDPVNDFGADSLGTDRRTSH